MEIKQAVINAPQLLTRKEAADYIGVKPGTLAVWACTHRQSIPFLKIGTKTVRYRREDLDAWLASRIQT
jgi:excisionase family DNA binding protein